MADWSWAEISDAADDAWVELRDAAVEYETNRREKEKSEKPKKTEPQNVIAGRPGVDISNAPASMAVHSFMGFSPMQLGLGAAALVVGFIVVRKL